MASMADFLRLYQEAREAAAGNPMLPGQVEPGNIRDLGNRPTFVSPNGDRMTVYSLGFRDRNGQEVLIPQVVGGRLLSSDQAIEHYEKTNEHLGKFEPTERGIEASNRMGELVHLYEQARIRDLLKSIRF